MLFKLVSHKLASSKRYKKLDRQLVQNNEETKKQQQSIQKIARKDKKDLQKQIDALQTFIIEVRNNKTKTLTQVKQERLKNKTKIRSKFEF